MTRRSGDRLSDYRTAHLGGARGSIGSRTFEVQSTDRIIEMGFGPAVATKRLSMLTGHVAGLDLEVEKVVF